MAEGGKQIPETAGPVVPARLRDGDQLAFSCHRDIACWNECCRDTEITLTPADILRLRRRFAMAAGEFVERYTIAAYWERAPMPVARLRMRGGGSRGECPFVTDRGCRVYEDRPVSCRYYPLGLASIKMSETAGKEDFCFLVREDHCRGHDRAKRQTVAEFRAEQGTGDYDRVNRGWIDILMKSASWASLGGPFGKDPEVRVKQMFYMISTDVDSFRRFVLETRFLDSYEVDPRTREAIGSDDEALLRLGFEWMKNVLFNEPTVTVKESVLGKATAGGRGKATSDTG